MGKRGRLSALLAAVTLALALLACGGSSGGGGSSPIVRGCTTVNPIGDTVNLWQDPPSLETVRDIPTGLRCEILGDFTYDDGSGEMFYYKVDCGGGRTGFVWQQACD